MNKSKKFRSGQVTRFSKLSKSLFVAGAHLASSKIKEKIKNIDSDSITAKVKASKEIIETMGAMKGGLMKLGQMISITEDLVLSPEVTALFKKLQKSAPPMIDADLNKMFKSSFGKTPSQIFYRFNPSPIAAASIGQVHEAWIDEHTKVAVKVQYPKIKKAIQADFQNMDKLKSVLLLLFPNLPNIDNYLEEMKRSIIDECDYRKEASNINWFRKNLMPQIEGLYIPKVFSDYSSDTILTMEYVDGDSIEIAKTYPQKVRNKIGQVLFNIHMKSIYDLNRVHTDPQNGNYLFTHEKVILLDFGSVREFPREFIDSYIRLIQSIEKKDFDAYREMIQYVGFLTEDEDVPLIHEHFKIISEMYLPYTKEGIYGVDKRNPFKMIEGFVKSVNLKGRKTPREEFVLLDRSNLGFYTKVKFLESEIDWLTSKHEAWETFYSNSTHTV